MSTRLIRTTGLILLIAAGVANRVADAQDSNVAEDAYRIMADEFLARYLAWRPQEAVGLGLHEFDGKTTDLSRDSIELQLSLLRAFRQRFAEIDGATLDRGSDVQRRLLMTAIDNELLKFESMKSYSRNPMVYAGAIDVNVYAKRDFAPKAERLRSVVAALRRMPDVMKAARDNLDEALPKPFVETAIQVADGGAEFLRRDLVEAFDDVGDKGLQAEFRDVNGAASSALRDYAEYLKREKSPAADDQFAIGRDAYVRMLADGELISQSPEEILEIGLRELRKEQEIFARTAARIDPDKPAIEVFRTIQQDHPTAESLLPDTRQHLEMIRSFLVEKDLVTFPSDVRVIVDETPRYARAVSFASMDSPGAFETKATQAYYYVTPVEPEWDEKRKDEWLTAFNFYTTDVVSIHEAYPGHYVQYLHLQASDADRIDKVFSSYAFIEGWAHYCEQMAIDEGFGADQGPLAAEKYRLAQSDEALLRLCRLCVSIKMHTQGMTLEGGTKFFMGNCYYEEAPARAEANRGTYDPGYCFYTIGKLQLLKLREEYRQQEGGNFSLKKFHDEVLRHGAPPVRLLREMMLKDPSRWEATL
jgi:uncharacterized protein (DUF885 family)